MSRRIHLDGKMTRILAMAGLCLLSSCFTAAAIADDGGSGSGSPSRAREISGVVQSMPASGLIGDWKIAGKSVVADGATAFDRQNGVLGIGAAVVSVGGRYSRIAPVFEPDDNAAFLAGLGLL